MNRPITVIEAPSNLGLRPPEPGKAPGVYRMPEVFRASRFVERIGAIDGGRVEAPAYDPEWYPGIGHRNGAAIRDYSLALAERVGATVDAGQVPLVIGGDCSIILGNMLALRRRGRYGLVYLDGHTDFRHPGNAEAVGAVAGEDLAILTGRGEAPLIDLDGLGPLIQESDAIAMGDRENDPTSSDMFETEISVWDLAELRGRGMVESAEAAPAHFAKSGVDGFWIHLDVDVLDHEIMPAVDSPQPGGLSYSELGVLLRPLLASELSAGIEITIYDPDLDPGGRYGARLVDELVALFAR
jgi:arginase